MSQHTSGPWSLLHNLPHKTNNYDKLYRLAVYAPREDKRPGIPRGYAVVGYGLSHHAGEAEANARLIAKAPEMYELLRRIAEATIGHGCVPLQGYNNEGGHIDGFQDTARALLREIAEGERGSC